MMSPTQAQLHQLIRTLAPQWSSREIGELTYLPGGYSNHNYRFAVAGEHFVLRAPGRVVDQAALEREAQFYRHFSSQPDYAGIPTLVTLDTTTGAMISRWQAGPLLIDETTSPESLVAYLAALHEHLPASDHTYDPLGVSREYLSRGEPDRDIVDALASLRWQPDNPRPCHNDLNPWNVIVCEPQPWLTLDWEWFGNNDPLFDLVTLHQGLSWDENILEDMAAALPGGRVSEQRLLLNLQVFWLREYAWAHAALVAGSQRSEIIAQKQMAAERFRRWSD